MSIKTDLRQQHYPDIAGGTGSALVVGSCHPGIAGKVITCAVDDDDTGRWVMLGEGPTLKCNFMSGSTEEFAQKLEGCDVTRAVFMGCCSIAEAMGSKPCNVLRLYHWAKDIAARTDLAYLNACKGIEARQELIKLCTNQPKYFTLQVINDVIENQDSPEKAGSTQLKLADKLQEYARRYVEKYEQKFPPVDPKALAARLDQILAKEKPGWVFFRLCSPELTEPNTIERPDRLESFIKAFTDQGFEEVREFCHPGSDIPDPASTDRGRWRRSHGARVFFHSPVKDTNLSH